MLSSSLCLFVARFPPFLVLSLPFPTSFPADSLTGVCSRSRRCKRRVCYDKWKRHHYERGTGSLNLCCWTDSPTQDPVSPLEMEEENRSASSRYI